MPLYSVKLTLIYLLMCILTYNNSAKDIDKHEEQEIYLKVTFHFVGTGKKFFESNVLQIC